MPLSLVVMLIPLHLKVRRKDWLESMIHHIATVILLAYSYWVNFTRIGVMVILLHDVGDIFLEAAKLARWVGQGSGTGQDCFVASLLCSILQPYTVSFSRMASERVGMAEPIPPGIHRRCGMSSRSCLLVCQGM